MILWLIIWQNDLQKEILLLAAIIWIRLSINIKNYNIFSFYPTREQFWSPAIHPSSYFSTSSHYLAISVCLQFLHKNKDTADHRLERLFDVMSLEGAGLHEHHIIIFGVFLAMLICIAFILHLSERYCLRSDLLPTIRQTISSLP